MRKKPRPEGIWVVVFVHSILVVGFWNLMAPAFDGYLRSRAAEEVTQFPFLIFILALTYVCTWLVWAGLRKVRIPLLMGSIVVSLLWALEISQGFPFAFRPLSEDPNVISLKSSLALLAVPASVLWCVWLGRYLFGASTKEFFSDRGG